MLAVRKDDGVLTVFLVVFLVSAFAALMQAAVGFGFAVVFTPLLSLAMSAHDAVALSLILSMSLSLVVYYSDQPRASFRSVMPMFLAATLVTPLGVYALQVANDHALRIAIGSAVLISVGGSLLTPHPVTERPQRLPAIVGVGVLSGLLRGATGMGGPPVVLYEHWRGAPMADIRRRLLAFFALTGVAGTLLAAGSGVFTRDTFIHATAGLPAVAIALYGGRYIRPRLSVFWFRAISMGLLIFTGAVSVLGALR